MDIAEQTTEALQLLLANDRELADVVGRTVVRTEREGDNADAYRDFLANVKAEIRAVKAELARRATAGVG